MISKDVYALISDVLAIAGRYSAETLRAALVHVEQAFQGDDRHALLRIIQTLLFLTENRERNGADAQSSPLPDGDLELHEFSAILQDPAFMPRKADLLAFLDKVMRLDSLGVSSKDSRAAVVRKAINSFARLPQHARTRAYKMLHTRFIKNRGSSLKGWSDIISE